MISEDRYFGCFFCVSAVGQLGNPDAGNSVTSLPAEVASGIDELFAGWVSSCALTENGEFLCWGLNDEGQANPYSPNTAILSPTPISFDAVR